MSQEQELVSIYFHLNNIPASKEQPFELEIEGNTIFQTEESIPAEEQCVIEAKIPRPKISEIHWLYVHYIVRTKGYDDIQKLNITDNGDHVLIKISQESEKIEIRQRNDDDFGQSSDYVVPTDDVVSHEGYKFKKVAVKTKKADSIMSSGETFKTIYFYLVNIPASKSEPFQISCEGKNLVLKSEPMQLNRQEIIAAKVKEPKIADAHIVTLKIKINSLGVEAKQNFNLTDKGNYIQIAVTGDENVRILQRKDDQFDKLPWISPSEQSQKTQVPSKHGGTGGTAGSPVAAAGGKVTLNIFLENVQASMTKPCQIFVNKKLVYTLKSDLQEGQVALVSVDLNKPPGNQDHIICIGYRIMKQGFKETMEQDFNISKYGRYIKFTVVEVVKHLNFTINVEQKHEAFTAPGTGQGQIVGKVSPFSKPGASSLSPEASKLSSFMKMVKPGLGSSPTPSPSTPQKTTVSNASTPNAAAATSQATSVSSPSQSTKSLGLEDLEKLASLRDKGILTEEEFQAKKKQILGL